MKVSLDSLEALAAIHESGSFAAAARSLGKAQSAVSYAVKQLENALDVDVFDRTGHRAVLTPVGVAVLDEGQSVLARARRLEWLASRMAEGCEARLDVVFDGALPVRPVLRALSVLVEEGVPTHVQVAVEYLDGVAARFERESADLMIALRVPRRAAWERAPLAPVQMVLVAQAGHRVHNRDTPHTTLSLQDYVELSVHDSSDAARGLDTNAVGGARVVYLPDFRSKADALRMGMGFGWVPEELVADDLESGALSLVSAVGGARRTLQPWLVSRSDRPLGPTGRRLWELLMDCAP